MVLIGLLLARPGLPGRGAGHRRRAVAGRVAGGQRGRGVPALEGAGEDRGQVRQRQGRGGTEDLRRSPSAADPAGVPARPAAVQLVHRRRRSGAAIRCDRRRQRRVRQPDASSRSGSWTPCPQFHTEHCAAIQSLDAEAIPLAQALEDGFTECTVCRPAPAAMHGRARLGRRRPSRLPRRRLPQPEDRRRAAEPRRREDPARQAVGDGFSACPDCRAGRRRSGRRPAVSADPRARTRTAAAAHRLGRGRPAALPPGRLHDHQGSAAPRRSRSTRPRKTASCPAPCASRTRPRLTHRPRAYCTSGQLQAARRDSSDARGARAARQPANQMCRPSSSSPERCQPSPDRLALGARDVASTSPASASAWVRIASAGCRRAADQPVQVDPVGDLEAGVLAGVLDQPDDVAQQAEQPQLVGQFEVEGDGVRAAGGHRPARARRLVTPSACRRPIGSVSPSTSTVIVPARKRATNASTSAAAASAIAVATCWVRLP